MKHTIVMKSFVLAGVIAGISTTVHAITLRVENWGNDANPCLTTAAPCRSISHAISVANPGDTISVGPGLYSDDLDRDGVFNEPGEEPMAGIVVDRDVTVQSTDGASATEIRRVQANGNAVRVTASGVTFGKKNKGFTVSILEQTQGLLLDFGGDNAEVAGNVVNIDPASGTTSAGVGFTIVGNNAFVHDNKVLGYGNSPNATYVSVGYLMFGASGARLDHNTSLDCDDGFLAGGPGLVMTRNVAVGSRSIGITTGTITEFTRNGALGNNLGVSMGAAPTTFGRNSFIGTTGVANCGFNNNSGGAIVATNNFWGSAFGPGVDPADNLCNVGMSTTVMLPFATHDFTQLQSPQR